MNPVPGLSQDQLEQLHRELVAERDRLRRIVARARAAGPVILDQTSVGRLSRMDALMNEGLAQSSQARSAVDLVLAEDALSRMVAGTYGFCLECHRAIPLERLSVMPETRTCAPCG